MSINSKNATATNKKISEIYHAIKDKNLILQPEFQRKFVWNNKHRTKFIDTILSGLPFPEIYIADSGVDLDKSISQEVVVDGQQRLTTIVQYIDGLLEITPSGAVKSYKECTAEQQKDFLNYKVVVRQLEGVDSTSIKEIFRRINLTRYPLNAYEIHNAIYAGEFISTAAQIAEDKIIKSLSTFNDADYLRMRDLGFILLIMATVENGGYFNGDTDIESYTKKYDDNYPNKEKAEKEILKLLKLISTLGLSDGSIWFKKSNLFTLLVELYGIAAPTDLLKKLVDFEKRLQENKNLEKKETNDFSRYYFYTAAGTNSRQARVERSRIFRKYIFNQDK